MSDWEERLLQAKKMLEMGLLDPKEFDDLKRQLKAEVMANFGDKNSEIPAPSGGLSGATIVASSEPVRSLSGATTVEPASAPIITGDLGVPTEKSERIGDYDIIEAIGEGGMGNVFRGRHSISELGKQEGDVAIKMMHPKLAADAHFKNRFIREASLGKSINHPNIAKVHHVYSSPLALVLTYIDGQELGDLIPKKGLSLAQTLSYLRPIAEALDHLHEKGVIHRDIKPANIKVTATGQPMLLDFGIAKDTKSISTMTKTNMAMGTEGYMAPEQMNAKHVGPGADQYALAMTAYQCLCGSLPWAEGETSAQVVMRKMTRDFVSLKDKGKQLPIGVWEAIEQALSVEVSQRYGTCIAFLDQFLALSADFSVSESKILEVEEVILDESVLVPDNLSPLVSKENETAVGEVSTVQVQEIEIPIEDENLLSMVEPTSTPSKFKRFALMGMVFLFAAFGLYFVYYSAVQSEYNSRIQALSSEAMKLGLTVPRRPYSASEVMSYELKVVEQRALSPRVIKLSSKAKELGVPIPKRPFEASEVSSFERGVAEQKVLSPRVQALSLEAKSFFILIPSRPYSESGVRAYELKVTEQRELSPRVDLLIPEAEALGMAVPSRPYNASEVEKFELDVPEKRARREFLQDMISTVTVNSGTFMMGCLLDDFDCSDRESPRHEVTLSRSMEVMTTEVTQGLYEFVVGVNPSEFPNCGSECPVETVKWFEAVAFANSLSWELGIEECYTISGEDVVWSNTDCVGWRLPTEAEWEFIARGGASHLYPGSNRIEDVAWYGEDLEKSSTHPVGQKQANGYGLYDMSGNVWEWCWDWHDSYNSAPLTDPKGPSSGTRRVTRGGSWSYTASRGRTSERGRSYPALNGGSVGFRLIRNSSL